jgi:hypothetical protein
MADEAFALSPISARAAQPSEEDYDAIKEAFMETSRGRWFLGEYAKRNRNADTSMVLDAVSRIEETLAAQKQPERDPLLDEALASFRAALATARAAATAALDDLAMEQNLAPVRKGARVIREIAWRLREIGADGRICDLIDSQVAAIEAAAGKLNSADIAAALHGAFERVEDQIASFDADGAAATHPSPAEASAPQTPAEAETATSHSVASDETPMAEAADEPADAFDANDEAMLDMVAMEMGAPDSDAAYDPTPEELQAFEASSEEPQALAPAATEISESTAAYEIDITFPNPGDAAKEPATATPLPVVTPLQSAPEPEPSLGSSLLANGIVQRPRASRPDPLAPIRRMSQTEKIAFFS